ncbi:MAG: hypothetical protein N3A72_03150 [bacterium]|nr:hypothetical protein [bacterium]
MKKVLSSILSIGILFLFSVAVAKDKKQERFDLDNPKFYTYTKYSSKFNKPIYLELQVTDTRPEADIAADTILWMRPVAEMMKSIFEKELQLSGIAKPPTAISSLNLYRIDIEILLFSGITQPKPGKKITQWAIPQMIVGKTELRITISKPDGVKINTTTYSGEANKDLLRTMNQRVWTAKMLGASLESIMEQALRDLDSILTRPSR